MKRIYWPYRGSTTYEGSVIVFGHELGFRFPLWSFFLCGIPFMLYVVDPDEQWRRLHIPLLPARVVRRVRKYGERRA